MKRVLLLFMLLSVAVLAQGQKVEGVLKGAKDGEPVIFANVALVRTSDSAVVRGVTSDEKGAFSITLDTSRCLLCMSAVGYITRYIAPQYAEHDTVVSLGEVVLDENPTMLKEVSVVADKPIYAVDGEKLLYNVSDDASVQTGMASDVLQNAPGVEVDAAGNVTVNGSSVELWINDRPSNLSGEALRQYISMLPANSIERVEVIRNPSVRYESGNPVLNIITYRKMLYNSFVSFGANGSTRPSAAPWVSYVYSDKKLNVSVYVNGSSRQTERDTRGGGGMYDAADSLAWTYRTLDTSSVGNANLYLRASYEIDSMNSVSGYFGTYPNWSDSWGWSSMHRSEYLDGVELSDRSSYDRFFSDNSLNYGGYGGMDYTHRFDKKGHKVSFYLRGSFFGFMSNDSEQRLYLSPAWPYTDYTHRTETNNLTGNGVFGVDYTLPYSKNGSLKMGANIGLGGGHNYYRRDTLIASSEAYGCDYLRSDTSYSPGRSASAYLSWRQKWGEFTVDLGGRLNYSYSTIHRDSEPQYDVAVHRLTASPSLNMSYTTKRDHSFSFSYRMNTTLPGAGSLCTYENYGVESYSTGNPYLRPEYEHNASLSWYKFFTKFGMVSVDASYKANIDEVSTISDARYMGYFGRVVSYSVPYNCNDARKFVLNASGMYRFSAFCNVRLSGGITDDWFSVVARQGEPPVEDELLSWNVRCRVWAKLWKKLQVFATASYSSPSLGWSTLQISHARKDVSLGMSADFFDRKLSLYFNASDIFNWNSSGTSNINPYNSSYQERRWNSRFISLGATLRFGKMELESRAQAGMAAAGSTSEM